MSTLTNRTFQISTAKGYLPTEAELTANYREALAAIAAFFDRCAGGIEPGAAGETLIQMVEGSTDAAAVAASGTAALSGVAGPTGTVTIGGKAVTFDSTGNDAADAAALKAAIDADAEVSEVVSASVDTATVTITAKQKGVAGNLISLVTATAGITLSGARLTGGVGGGGTFVNVQF